MNAPVQLDAGIELLNGTFFSFDDCSVDEIDIELIAHVLSQINRFAGHTIHPYSVAQHAINASYIVEAGFEYCALMHDTAEMVTNDIVTPLKAKVSDFKEIEVKTENAMAKKFGFQYPLPWAVKRVDLQLLGIEKDALKPAGQEKWAILEGVEYEHLAALCDLDEHRPRDIARRFLERYWELCP